jgi:hypothetical protein
MFGHNNMESSAFDWHTNGGCLNSFVLGTLQPQNDCIHPLPEA